MTVPFCVHCEEFRVWHFDTMLCARCDHRSRTRKRTGAKSRSAVAPHGTEACWRSGCRREECREAHAEAMRRYRNRRRQAS